MAARITDLKVVQASADSAREAAQLRLGSATQDKQTNEKRLADLHQEKKETEAFLNDAIERLTP